MKNLETQTETTDYPHKQSVKEERENLKYERQGKRNRYFGQR